MGLARRVAYKLFGDRVPLWEDLRKRRVIDGLRGSGVMLTPLDAAIATLRFKGLMPLHPLVALEPFGRMGIWKTLDYVHLCQSLDFYEIAPHFAANAKRILPLHANVHCADSFAAVNGGLTPRHDYNFVLLDNGIGEIYGDSYCEHFDMIPGLFDLLAPNAVVVGNLFRSSAAISSFDSAYVERRREFYKTGDPMRPTLDQVIMAYRSRLPAHLSLRDAFTVAHPKHPAIPNNEMHFVVLSLAPGGQ